MNPVSRIVNRVSAHVSGDGCKCAAYGENECGCPNVDWRSRKEVALQAALDYCLTELKLGALRVPEIIRNTGAIAAAGNYQRYT